MTDYKDLCADLVDALTAHGQPDDDAVGYVAGLLTRARAALDEPEPEGPTDEQLDELFIEIDQTGEPESWRTYAHAVRARLGNSSAPQPLLVSEPPRPEDCDAEGRCWWLIEPYPRPVGPSGKLWSLCRYCPGANYWLPANALPQPS